jgi:hypothetical protein
VCLCYGISMQLWTYLMLVHDTQQEAVLRYRGHAVCAVLAVCVRISKQYQQLHMHLVHCAGCCALGCSDTPMQCMALAYSALLDRYHRRYSSEAIINTQAQPRRCVKRAAYSTSVSLEFAATCVSMTSHKCKEHSDHGATQCEQVSCLLKFRHC